jgi:hypothetical protein
MPRFFFNYRERDEYTVDDIGVDFETFELAYLDGFNAAGQMWPEIMARRIDPRTCAFEILDGSGHLLAVLNFNELLENCSPCARVATHDFEGALASVADSARHTRRKLAEFQEELGLARGRLNAVRKLIDLIGDTTDHGKIQV